MKVPTGHGWALALDVLGGQKWPRGHGDVDCAGCTQYVPVSQSLHTALPSDDWYVPGGQGTAEMSPPGHLWPFGHLLDATDWPPGQKNPAGHVRTGVTIPALGHT